MQVIILAESKLPLKINDRLTLAGLRKCNPRTFPEACLLFAAQNTSETEGLNATLQAPLPEEQSKLTEETENNDSLQPGEEKIKNISPEQQFKVKTIDIPYLSLLWEVEI